jgi:NAD(P)-dependent dehydrogenase (short-subunit alcohol dehydrogenase family)
MGDLKGKIAVVTGASRGIGKGIALALGEQGCIVYVTGRTTGDGERTIDTTARLVSEAGGEWRRRRHRSAVRAYR